MKPENLGPITNFFYRLTQPPSQIIVMAITIIIASAIASKTFNKYVNFESMPEIKKITPSLIKTWQADPTIVTLGLHIRNFPAFDFSRNSFVIDGVIWFEFDPLLIPLKTISKFSFDKAQILYKSKPITKIDGEKIFARYDIKFSFQMNLDYRLFPFDNHRMNIALVNRDIPPTEIIYQSAPSLFTISSDINFHGWNISNKNVITGYTESYLEKDNPAKNILNPQVVFSIDFNRTDIRNVSLLIFPLFLIFFFGLLSLAFDPFEDSTLIMALATGSVTLTLSFRFVMESLTPRVGYFVFSDYVYLSLLLVSILELIFAILAVRTKPLTKSLITMRSLLFMLCIFIFIFIWYFFLYRQVRDANEKFITSPQIEKKSETDLPAALSVPAIISVTPEQKDESKIATDKKADDVIRIGTTLDLSRSIKQLGLPLRNGMLLAFNQFNKDGGFNDKLLALDDKNDEYNPQKALENVEYFIQKNMDILLAPLGTITFASYRELVEQKKVLALFPVAGAISENLEYVVQLRVSNPKEASVLTKYVHSHYKPEKYLIFYQDDLFGKETSQAIKQTLNKEGFENISEIPFSRNTTDFSRYIDSIKEERPNAICFLGTSIAAMNLIRQAGTTSFYGKILFGMHPLLESQFVKYLERGQIKFVISSNSVPYYQAKDLEIVKEFNDQAAEQNITPSMMSLYGYIAAEVFIDFLKQVKGPLTKEALLQVIKNTKNYNFKGLTLDFDPSTRRLLHSVWIKDNQTWSEIKLIEEKK